MFGSTRLAAVLGAAPELSSDYDSMAPFLRAAARAEIALLFCGPGTKVPLDLRTAQAKTKADNAAREAAQAEGNPRWQTVESPRGLHLATHDSAVLTRYFKRAAGLYPDPVNLALEVGRSRVIVVDVDTPEERTAFLRYWSDMSGVDMSSTPPTVSSPGSRDPRTGEWAHHGGGHYYFTVPDGVELPTGPGLGNWTVRTAAGQFSLAWAGRYLMIPPSVRAEGAYRWTGMDVVAPEWLVDMILHRGAEAALALERSRQSREDDPEFHGGIDEWAESVSWDDILSPAGWVATMDNDTCSCAIWTAPGEHYSPKSATAHEGSCALGRYSVVNAPLHVWTDHTDPSMDAWLQDQNTKTVTKLQAYAVYRHDGDVSAACRALGLSSPTDGGGVALSAADLGLTDDPPWLPSAPTDASHIDPFMRPTDPSQEVGASHP